jgi:hypothetical protein
VQELPLQEPYPEVVGTYEHDFDDGWHHEMLLEKMLEREPNVAYDPEKFSVDKLNSKLPRVLSNVKPLLLPYLFNIAVLIPVALTMPVGGASGTRLVFQGKLPESAEMRTISASAWTVILIGSVIGLFHPVSMSPVLLIQVIYNSLWLGVFVVPLLIRGRSVEVDWAIAGTFLFIVLTYPWVIPWGKVLGG